MNNGEWFNCWWDSCGCSVFIRKILFEKLSKPTTTLIYTNNIQHIHNIHHTPPVINTLTDVKLQ